LPSKRNSLESLKSLFRRRSGQKEELEDFIMNRLKLPTVGMLFSLLDSPMVGDDLVGKINQFLEMNESELVKGPMALGAIMGALSKHYSGIKEELVLREGKRYRLADKYRAIISEIKRALREHYRQILVKRLLALVSCCLDSTRCILSKKMRYRAIYEM
jgi:hypothetical protein